MALIYCITTKFFYIHVFFSNFQITFVEKIQQLESGVQPYLTKNQLAHNVEYFK